MGNMLETISKIAVLLAVVAALAGCPAVGGKVTADFVGIPRIGYAPLTVTFRADVQAIPPYVLNSKFRDGARPTLTIVDYMWTFGDGGVGKGKTAIHVYRNPGKYDVGLTVIVR